MSLNELTKTAKEKRLTASEFLSLIGENTHSLTDFEARTLLKNALWFIANDDEESDRFMTYLNDYETDFCENHMKGE